MVLQGLSQTGKSVALFQKNALRDTREEGEESGETMKDVTQLWPDTQAEGL